jgi:hypothetical protein
MAVEKLRHDLQPLRDEMPYRDYRLQELTSAQFAG